MPVPDIRVQACNTAPVNALGDFVLYWMIAHRRTQWNFSLQRAVEYAQQLNKPLIVLEALRCDYRWASDRLHRFVIEGMRDNAERLQTTKVLYYPYIEPARNAGKGLLAALSRHACVVVTDDFPAFMLPHMIAAAAQQLNVRLEKIDSNGILPIRAAGQVFPTAYAFRRFLQKNLHAHLQAFPAADPLRRVALPALNRLPEQVLKRWPRATEALFAGEMVAMRKLPIDHSVGTVTTRGGPAAAQKTLRNFLEHRLSRYAEERNQPQQEVASGLSPYLHFGHISAHQVFAELMQRENWSPALLPPKGNGAKEGWWGVSAPAESFLDEFVTWREVGYNFCSQREDYDQFESLPSWAQQTLAKHARDRREHVYTRAQFENAETHDALWNAAQMQLLVEGRVHNYLRMLWGKKILQWSRTPQAALELMIELNNKYALDGRNPNSYSGIFWVLGRYDRPWHPERPVFGVIRYMSSENTARKVRVREYINKYLGFKTPTLFDEGST